jgi:hypothetical protein
MMTTKLGGVANNVLGRRREVEEREREKHEREYLRGNFGLVDYRLCKF